MGREFSFYYSAGAFLLTVGLFLGMLAMMALGHRLRQRTLAGEADTVHSRLTGVEAAIFGLMGLMVAFTFSGAADRYELRRQLVVEETNAIRTAYLRLDLLPAHTQPALRDRFHRYVEARLAIFRALPDIEAAYEQIAVAAALQKEIWTGILAALKEASSQSTIMMIPALNQMIDITSTRTSAVFAHTPKLVFVVLLIIGLVCSLLAGYVSADTKPLKYRLPLVGFAAVWSLTIYLIFDLDYPRFGIIRLDFADQAFIDLLAGMK